jgi:hypothetical protein
VFFRAVILLPLLQEGAQEAVGDLVMFKKSEILKVAFVVLVVANILRACHSFLRPFPRNRQESV